MKTEKHEFLRWPMKNLLANTVTNLKHLEGQNVVLKLKLLFAKDHTLCLKEIGSKNLEITQIQIAEFSKAFHLMDQFESGKQNNIAVNCQGIIYVDILNGKVNAVRNVNFHFQ